MRYRVLEGGDGERRLVTIGIDLFLPVHMARTNRCLDSTSISDYDVQLDRG